MPPERTRQPFLSRLRARTRGPVLAAALKIAELKGQQSQLPTNQQPAAATQLNQAQHQARLDQRSFREADKLDSSEKEEIAARRQEVAEKSHAVNKQASYTGSLNKKPQEQFAPLTTPNPQQESAQEEQNSPGQEAASPDEAPTTLRKRLRSPEQSPLQRRRLMQQIRNTQQEVGELEGKTTSTRRREKTDKILREGIKMAATAETVIGLIYYIAKLLIVELLVHKDGPQVKRLQRQISAKKIELAKLKRQAHKAQLASARNS